MSEKKYKSWCGHTLEVWMGDHYGYIGCELEFRHAGDHDYNPALAPKFPPSEVEQLRASLRATEEALAVAEKALERCEGLYCDEAASEAKLNREQHDANCFIRAALSALKNKPAMERVRVAREKVVEQARWVSLGQDGMEFNEMRGRLYAYDESLRDAGMAP